MQRVRCTSQRWLALLLVSAIAMMAIPAAQAYTDPNNYNLLVAFRDSMVVRSSNWVSALALWKCPTPPANTRPAGTCDPCGEVSDGNWYHMHCRGNSRGWGESGDGTKDGITTNMHITSSLVDGPVPKELCIIPTLREHDFGGQLNRGHLTGPFPRWLAKCYQKLEELDLSNNRLTGTLPPYLGTMPVLSEIKFENNGIIGTIPPEIGQLSRLRRFQAEFNNMNGPIPKTFANAAPYLTQLHLARNDFEGDLSMLAQGHLTTVTVHDNPKLCGMVPATVRFAKGYNPGGTNLGKPCPGGGVPAAAPTAAGAVAGDASGNAGSAAGGTGTPVTQPATNASSSEATAASPSPAAEVASSPPATATAEGASSPAPAATADGVSSPAADAADVPSSPAASTAEGTSQPSTTTEDSPALATPSGSDSGSTDAGSDGGAPSGTAGRR